MDKTLQRIHKGNNGIDYDLFQITGNAMDKAIDKSVKLKYNVKNQAFINEPKTSSKVFSAFKNHHQSKALAAILMDQEGKIVSFSKFKKDALKITDKYNKVWLKTEYNTALRRGRIGAKFQKFREDAHLLPNLKWLPSTAAELRSTHISYYGMVLPINDPFWINQFPGNEWNCKCDVEQTMAKAGTSPSYVPTPPKGLEGNPAFTGQLIGSKHPYFKGLSSAESKEVQLLVNKETDKEINKWAKRNIDKNGLEIQSKMIQSDKLILLQSDVNSILKKQNDAFVKTYITVLKDEVENLKYIGFEKAGVNIFTYYQTKYGDQKVFIKMKVSDDFEQPYLIATSIDKGIIINEKLQYSRTNNF